MGASYRERGQMILVTSISLAAVFVAIALVLNSAIYTENVATRTNQQEPRHASNLREAAGTGAGAGLTHAHHDTGSHSTYSTLKTAVDGQVVEWTELHMRDAAREGRVVDVEYVPGSALHGTRVGQDDGSAYEPQDLTLVEDLGTNVDVTTDAIDLDTWVVAEDVNRMRRYRMTVDKSALEPETQADVEVYLGNLGADISLSDPPFVTVYDEDATAGLDHAFAIYESDADSDDVKITYADLNTGERATCTVEDAPAEFDVAISEARVNAANGDCETVFEFVSEVDSPYQLVYVEGDEIAGDWEFVVDSDNTEFENDMESLGSILLSDFYDDHADGHGASYGTRTSPFLEPALYEVVVRVTYESNAVRYTGTTTVAPAQPG